MIGEMGQRRDEREQRRLPPIRLTVVMEYPAAHAGVTPA